MDAPEVRPSHDPEHYTAQYHDAPEVSTGPLTKSDAPHTYDNGIPETKDILGLKPKNFWILLVVLIVVVAAAVGGGVGGGLAAQKNRYAQYRWRTRSPLTSNSSSPSSRSSSTSTLSQAQASTLSTTTPTSSISIRTSTASSTLSAATAGFSSGCNATDGKIYTPLDTSASNAPFSINGTTLTYKIYCYTNFASKTSGHNPNISEILQQEDIASLDDCITLCAAYNKALANPTPDALCSVPVYTGPANATYCYLQSGNAEGAITVLFGPDQEVDSAVLQFPGLY